jgi:hypothetical protein
VDPTQGEFIKLFAMRYGANQVEAVSLTTSSGETLFKGLSDSSMLEKRREFSSSVPLLAFYGTEDS